MSRTDLAKSRSLWGTAAISLMLALASAGSVAGDERFNRSSAYGAVTDHGVAIAAVPTAKVPGRYLRQKVSYRTEHAPGTVIVDPNSHFLYVVESGGKALRYGVSVGKGAFAWSGTAMVARKASWPKWTPPAEMIRRAPNLAVYDGGLDAGPLNPMGARALYLSQKGRDTLYRIHGTSEWWSIGDDASSGCIRLLNQDILDLSQRVKNGTKVVVLPVKQKFIRRN